MYIVPGSLELEQVPAVKTQLATLLQTVGVTVTSEYDMERRRLSYPIGKETYGYYQVVQFDATSTAVRELDAKLRLDNQLLRYLLVKARPLTAEQIKTMVIGEKYAKQKPQPVKPEVKTEKVSATALTEAELAFANAASKRVTVVEEEEQKLSVEELDKKLDAILEDTDLDKKL